MSYALKFWEDFKHISIIIFRRDHIILDGYIQILHQQFYPYPSTPNVLMLYLNAPYCVILPPPQICFFVNPSVLCWCDWYSYYTLQSFLSLSQYNIKAKNAGSQYPTYFGTHMP